MAGPPLFGAAAQCVQRVDKQAQPVLHVSYTVGADDTALMQGDIAVPDAKTHQFFAFRGALLAHDFGQELFPFAPPGAGSALLPSWITTADVKRAARATNTLDGTAFSEVDIPPGAVLEADPAFDDMYLRVTGDDARVPITAAQALNGVDWSLAGVAPGLYTFAGYVFSPPYNGWSPRAQRIEIVDGTSASAGPVLGVERVEGALFPYQGRRVRGCVDAPDGSQLNGWFSVLERPESGWIEWLPSGPIASGVLDLCFRDPRPELTGSLRLRFDVTAPDGTTRSFYSPDTITALPGSGTCAPSETICCPPGTTVAPSPSCPEATAGECAADAGADTGERPARSAGGLRDGAPGSAAGSARRDWSGDRAGAGADGGSGCAIGVSRGARHPDRGLGWLALALTFCVARLTRGRGHRKTAGSA